MVLITTVVKSANNAHYYLSVYPLALAKIHVSVVGVYGERVLYLSHIVLNGLKNAPHNNCFSSF